MRTTILRDVRKDVDDRLRSAGILDADDAIDGNPTHGQEADAAGADNQFSSSHLFGRAVCSDGWTSTTRRPLLNVTVVTAKGSYFLKAIDTSGATKTWQYQRDEFFDIIEEVGAANITAFFVDGGVPKKTRDAIEEKYPSIFVALCAAHSLDLLLEDFYKKCDWVKDVVDALKEIVTFIRNHHKPLALFRTHSKLELLKPGDTRFGSNFICLERLLQVHSALEQLVASKDWKQWVKRQKKAEKKAQAAAVKKAVFNERLWLDAGALIKASKPFVVAMKMADGDVPSMGKIYQRVADAIADLKQVPA